MLSFGFPPLASPSARVLILGSLPGRLSLERGEYYANAQNVFWKIVATQIPDLPPEYASRVAAIIEQNVAIWDVLAAATRSGSLDADISDDAIPNNFRALFHSHPHIQLIAFNGATAATLTTGTLFRHSRMLSERLRRFSFPPPAAPMRAFRLLRKRSNGRLYGEPSSTQSATLPQPGILPDICWLLLTALTQYAPDFRPQIHSRYQA